MSTTTTTPPRTVDDVDRLLRKTIARVRADEATGHPSWMQTERWALINALLDHRLHLTNTTP